MHSVLAVVAIACLGALYSLPLEAQNAVASTSSQVDRPTPPDDARRFFEAGTAHYRAGRYREAADDLERALQLDPASATLAYNLGRVYELLGEIDAAIQSYERYIQLIDDPDDVQRTSRTIERLRGAAEQQPESPPESDLVPSVDSGPEGSVSTWARWVVLGTGVALLAAGGSLGGLALVRDGQTRDFVLGLDGTSAERDAFATQTRRLALASDLLLAGGAAVAIGGTVWLLFSGAGGSDDSGTRVSLTPRRGGASLEVSGSL